MFRKRCFTCNCACLSAIKDNNPSRVCCNCFSEWCFDISNKEAAKVRFERRSRKCGGCNLKNTCVCFGKNCMSCKTWFCDHTNCAQSFDDLGRCQACVTTVDECPICLEEMSSRKNVTSRKRKKETSCGHIFHSGCLKTWLDKNCKCPLCCETLRETRRKFDSSQIVPPKFVGMNLSDVLLLITK